MMLHTTYRPTYTYMILIANDIENYTSKNNTSSSMHITCYEEIHNDHITTTEYVHNMMCKYYNYVQF